MTEVPTIVALGEVDPSLVVGHLPHGSVFVAEPTERDLSVAVAAIVRAHIRVDTALLERMPALRIIARTGVGTDQVDLVAAERREIAVLTTPGTGAAAVAEMTLAMMLHLVKRLTAATGVVRNGLWDQRTGLDIGDLEGLTIGVVGVGRIGRKVAYLADAFGMSVLAHDPGVQEFPGLVGLLELCERSNIVSLHLPLTDDNHHMVNSDLLDRLPMGSLLINCSRGGLVDLDAVSEALHMGRLGGVGLDVFETEPPSHHSLFDHPDVVLAPHVAGLSRRATEKTFAAAARGIADLLATPQG